MVNDFRQTVDLKERVANKKKTKRAAQINRVFNNDSEKEKTDNGLQKIDRPVIKNVNEIFTRRLVFLLAVIILIFLAYFLFFNKDDEKISNNWYSVKLVNNEIYYGKIVDTKADPVIISDVYYNYDQLNDSDTKSGGSGNLRLVKRGKETHGPEGTMNIVRSQILYMEALKTDSKVLMAILNYEK